MWRRRTTMMQADPPPHSEVRRQSSLQVLRFPSSQRPRHSPRPHWNEDLSWGWPER